MSTFVIAEAGSCHDGDPGAALDLIAVAKEAGADACKFQYWSSAERLAERRNAADYLNVYQRYQLPKVWLAWLASWCNTYGIEFMCTVYLPEDIATIAPLVERFKVASFEANDEEFVQAHVHVQYGRQIIISTGMQNTPQRHWDKSYLHCVSAYPCPLEQANLGVLLDGYYDGYSDHTHSVLTGALAVAAGAKILEVHFRLDDTDPANPDYATALSPGQLKDYIALVRQAEVMMGSGVKEPQPAETEMMKYRVRK